ncbi:MAG: RagB/SusD family nutrient uptake outer membrane protein [Chitinophagaceae bacterium]
MKIDPPINQLNSQLVFSSDNTATSAVTGIYSTMMATNEQVYNSALTLYGGLSADELYYFTPNYTDELYTNQLSIASHSMIERNIWTPSYKYIYMANACIEGIASSTALSPAIKNRLRGEAKFIRAFCFFTLVNLFGDVPLTLSTNPGINSTSARSPKTNVYDQIINDLEESVNLLPESYATTERVRPNKWAAEALLARVYLYNKEWAKAETKATTVINAGPYMLLPNPNDVFLGSSKEAIWQLKPVNPSRNTYEGRMILPSTSSAQPIYLLTSGQVSAFEKGDLRKSSWAKAQTFSGQTYYYPYKYKVRGAAGIPITEYYMVLRLAEQYLIRAEARAQLNNLIGAINDVNKIRNRSGLINVNPIDQISMLLAVEQERRVELFSELAHRWFDLKRTEKANSILSPLKGTNWQFTDQLWPIPQDQINLNPALTQNPGY